MNEQKQTRKLHLVVSCEHGGNRVPAAFAHLFRGGQHVLQSHRGYDPGSLELGRHFARSFGAPLHASTVTRLLVELNRSLGHQALFSEFTSRLNEASRKALLDKYYFPHRRRVEQEIRVAIEAGSRVVHLSMHTFTPELNGRTRNADVGLLYDPSRRGEKQLCEEWRKILVAARPGLRVRRNYPYLGRADGFTTWLRRHFRDQDYLGIELELNQSRVQNRRAAWGALIRDLVESFADARDVYCGR